MTYTCFISKRMLTHKSATHNFFIDITRHSSDLFKKKSF